MQKWKCQELLIMINYSWPITNHDWLVILICHINYKTRHDRHYLPNNSRWVHVKHVHREHVTIYCGAAGGGLVSLQSQEAYRFPAPYNLWGHRISKFSNSFDTTKLNLRSDRGDADLCHVLTCIPSRDTIRVACRVQVDSNPLH